MKLSKILHVLSIIAGLAGVVALVGAYIAGPTGAQSWALLAVIAFYFWKEWLWSKRSSLSHLNNVHH